MSFFGLMGAALCSVLLSVFIKQYRPEYSLLLSAFACTGLLCAAVALISPAFDYIRDICGGTAFSPYLTVILKACAMGLLTSLVCEISRDAGENAIAQKAALVGRCALLLTALPILKGLIEGVKSFI